MEFLIDMVVYVGRQACVTRKNEASGGERKYSCDHVSS